MNRILFTFIIACLLSSFALAQQAEEITYSTIQNIPYRDSTLEPLTDYMRERCQLDLYYPTNKKGFATIVWFHGGGLRAGEKHIAQVLKNQGIAVVAANYRLFPKVNAPAYIDDAAEAVAWAFDNIEQYGGDRSLIFVSGHSAGGYLASMVALDRGYLRKRLVDADHLAAAIPFSGHAITHFTIREERGIDGTTVVVDEFAPLAHIRKDAPPYIIITGDRELELLGRYEENAYLYRMMKLVGHESTELHELDGFNHGEMVEPAYHLLVKYVKNYIAKRQEQKKD